MRLATRVRCRRRAARNDCCEHRRERDEGAGKARESETMSAWLHDRPSLQIMDLSGRASAAEIAHPPEAPRRGVLIGSAEGAQHKIPMRGAPTDRGCWGGTCRSETPSCCDAPHRATLE